MNIADLYNEYLNQAPIDSFGAHISCRHEDTPHSDIDWHHDWDDTDDYGNDRHWDEYGEHDDHYDGDA